MKQKYREWEKLTQKRTTVKLSKYAGIRELEDDMVFATRARGAPSHRFQSQLDVVSKRIFGITYEETLWPPGEVPAWPYNLPWENLPELAFPSSEDEQRVAETRRHARVEAHRAQFVTPMKTTEDTAEFLLKWGWDFYDDQNRSLLITHNFCRQAEAVARGIMGAIADPSRASVDQFAARVEEEARNFLAKKRRA